MNSYIKIVWSLSVLTFIFTNFDHAKGQIYDALSAAEYSDEWAVNPNDLTDNLYHNPAYSFYEDNDCANFVSQCLLNGSLDLSGGTNGWGAGLNSDGCFINCENLHLFLKNMIETDYASLPFNDSPNELSSMEIGDVMIVGNSGDNWMHATFCASYDDNYNKLYNAHTNHRLHKNRNFFSSWTLGNFYHIIKIPSHCSDCVKDFDEDDIDCGGSCPPCTKAPSHIMYNQNTNNLPEESKALIDISAGNNDVQVQNGQNVNFSAGVGIFLSPGFEVNYGSNFHAEIKRLQSELTSDCESFCEPIIYNLFCYGDPMKWELANATDYRIEIYQRHNMQWHFIHEETHPIFTDGWMILWDGVSGVNSNDPTHFMFRIWISKCKGGDQYYHEDEMLFEDCDKSVELPRSKITDPLLYPNPTSGSLFISTPDSLYVGSKIEILSITGALVMEKHCDVSSIIKFDLSNEPTGIYFVRIIQKEKLFTFKVIKN